MSFPGEGVGYTHLVPLSASGGTGCLLCLGFFVILSHHYISRYIRNMNVILPYLCKSIIEGVKRYEYRKAIFKCSDISKVYMYATDSICKVIGYFTLE